MARNDDRHWEVTFDDGETFHEKSRDTFGGWVNMTRRLEARCGGGRMRPLDDTGKRWAVGDRAFTVMEVNVL